jgi:hypothetical protein
MVLRKAMQQARINARQDVATTAACSSLRQACSRVQEADTDAAPDSAASALSRPEPGGHVGSGRLLGSSIQAALARPLQCPPQCRRLARQLGLLTTAARAGTAQ